MYETYDVRVYENGDKYWFQNDQYHRLDGPAIEYANGDKFWFVHGKYHRLDGPAIERVDGRKFWYIEGEPMSKTEFDAKTQPNDGTCNGKIVEIDGKKYRLSII